MIRMVRCLLILLMAYGALCCLPVSAAAEPVPIPRIQIDVGEASDPEDVAQTLQIVFVLTVLVLAPSILMLMTSFTRIIIIFSFLRNALHTQQMPSNQILVGMALVLTFYIMSPVWDQINERSLKPYLAEEITFQDALQKSAGPLRAFMLKQTREKDLALMISLRKTERPGSPDDIPPTTLVPAFVISEISIAFTAGFIVFIPFLIIDMVVACVLLSMGMMMLPPVMVSLPFKILLFVLVDGWGLLIGTVVKSFQ